MKPSALLIAAAAAAALPSGTQTRTLVPVNLSSPFDWIAGKRLFPQNIIAGYSANMSEHTADSWAAHIVALCLNFTDCTSTMSFSAINSGSTGGRFWFGEVYRGGPTSPDDYHQLDGIQNSTAYSVPA